MAKSAKPKHTEAEELEIYLKSLKHPMRKQIDELRKIILSVDKRINERVKWNAPSYYMNEDFLTFNLRDPSLVHLIFHHKSIDSFQSEIFEGDYKGRRMVFFREAGDVKAKKKELVRIIKGVLDIIENNLINKRK